MKHWRRYGFLYILPVLLADLVFFNWPLHCCLMSLMCTIPCGIPIVNQKPWLWWPRQMFFGANAVAAFAQCL